MIAIYKTPRRFTKTQIQMAEDIAILLDLAWKIIESELTNDVY